MTARNKLVQMFTWNKSAESKVQDRNSGPALESLPTELKLSILLHSPDLSTLSALVHASPGLHKVYARFRSTILPQVTWRELAKRNIDLFKHTQICEVRIRNKNFKSTYLTAAFQQIFQHCRDRAWHHLCLAAPTDPNKLVGLNITQCITLLTIQEIVNWKIKRSAGHIRAFAIEDRDPWEFQEYWVTLNFTQYSSEDVEEMLKSTMVCAAMLGTSMHDA